MARKTREEAALTRQNIAEAARRLFYAQGVSATTLEQIARSAGVTRGAVYWHFADKSALIAALKDQLTISLVTQVDAIMLDPGVADPLASLEQGLQKIFAVLHESEAVRETLDIWLSQGTYVRELAEGSNELVQCHKEFVAKLNIVYERAAEKGVLRLGFSSYALAIDTDAFVVGLIRNWLLDACELGIRQNINDIIRSHIALRRPF